MKFLCLGYYTPQAFDRLGPADLEDVGRTCRPLDEEFYATGHVIEVGSLDEPHHARTLLPRHGKTVVKDGPYVETKEMIGSYFLLEAADLDEAVRLASLHPAARVFAELGFALEVRGIGFCRAR